MPIGADVKLAAGVRIHHPDLVNLYGCQIGDDTRIGAFVEIQKGATIGARCKISSHTFVCEGVTLEDEVFIGHGVMFTNDRYPRANTDEGVVQTDADWTVVPTTVKRRASIGSNARWLASCSACCRPNSLMCTPARRPGTRGAHKIPRRQRQAG